MAAAHRYWTLCDHYTLYRLFHSICMTAAEGRNVASPQWWGCGGHLLVVMQLADGRAKVRSYIKSPQFPSSNAGQPLGFRTQEDIRMSQALWDSWLWSLWGECVSHVDHTMPSLPLWTIKVCRITFCPPLSFVSDSNSLSDPQPISNEKHHCEETKTGLELRASDCWSGPLICSSEKVAFSLSIVQNACWNLLS